MQETKKNLKEEQELRRREREEKHKHEQEEGKAMLIEKSMPIYAEE